jgi:hypothetical protein
MVLIGVHLCASCRYWAVPEHPGCPDKVMHILFSDFSSSPFQLPVCAH